MGRCQWLKLGDTNGFSLVLIHRNTRYAGNSVPLGLRGKRHSSSHYENNSYQNTSSQSIQNAETLFYRSDDEDRKLLKALIL
jgi:hypothetical protein